MGEEVEREVERTTTSTIAPPVSGDTDNERMAEVADQRIADEIRDAIVQREPLCIVGAGTWIQAQDQAQASRILSLSHDRGVVAYNPNDLTLTIRAGTSLEEIDRVLEAHQQWLPLDPEGERHGTIGATVATCSYGPLAEFFGTPRDLVLGMTVVTGEGTIIRPGGRVVKNVAGFDLTRLMIGSWGTLGVITQVTIRVMARTQPAHTQSAHTQSTHTFEHMRRIMPHRYGYRKPEMTHPRLSSALKRRFDPHHILNPGFFEEVL